MKRAAIIFVALAAVPVITEAAPAQGATQRAQYLMGTVCEVAVAGAADANAEIDSAFAEAARIEAMLSTWTDESELARVNRGEAVASEELSSLLATAAEWSRRTGGAFNPRVKPLIDLWRTREEGALPAREAIDAALAVTAPAIEEGGFGKGYAIDRMLARISAPEAMIDFGGQLGVRGTLRVTIADPTDRRRPAIALTISNASISTSSGSEKTFEVDGRRFSHIIDPRSGDALPPRGSVSVIADDALTADILSTALYVLGEDDGLRWADENGIAAVFINSEQHVRLSAKARDRARDLEPLDRQFKVRE